ncbi:NAD-dependent deacylase [Nocardioides acrostichi]|uniref:NAD-dependent deacylase n=1 Tax=Nocardioides acrostichi TaxID=2784339 RepID=UPI002E2C6A31|nr:NAD-dependent deacylase [Nocardioides acrostichi]
MKIVVLTGAGISAESGVPTFRDADGLWEGHSIEEVATPEGFESQPKLVQEFYDARREHLVGVQPNAAHIALAGLEEQLPDDLLVVTQNIDDLHERAGSRNVIHMHGELNSAWCRACDRRTHWTRTLVDFPPCPGCGATELRPDVVWFGEIPYQMDRILAAVAEADLFVSVGTSGAVYPAAGFVQQALRYGAKTLELNLDPSEGSVWFHESRLGPASVLVPSWVDDVLASQHL